MENLLFTQITLCNPALEIDNFLQKFASDQVEIEWMFIPPATPRFGGSESEERLLQIFKSSLYKVIGSRTLAVFFFLLVCWWNCIPFDLFLFS